MNYVDKLNLFGVEAKEIPCIKGSGAPTSETVGAVGLFYMDTGNGDVYKCTAMTDGVYEWKRLSEETTIEPAEDDIPKVFFGGALRHFKADAIMSFRYISKTADISGYCKTKAQGNSSMAYPKKNQTVKLYKDAACTEKLKVNFKGWGEQNKFCFKANWIDLTHARNIVSARLWGDIVKSRPDYAELPEELRTSPNCGAVDGFPVKVYADGVYQGRYTINIPKDAWMAKMDDELDNHCILCGESGNAMFKTTPLIDGTDWTDEVHDTVPEIIKARWIEAVDFVMNSNDEDFRMNLENYFDIQSLIDYYLFGLVSCHVDGFHKNQLYLTYDGLKWYASVYDMDSTWGLYWDGTYLEYNQLVGMAASNRLYARLQNLFAEELKKRWDELKITVLNVENIVTRFERFTDICSAQLVEEDYAETTGAGAFVGIPLQGTNNIQQVRAYVTKRLTWADLRMTGDNSLMYYLPHPVTFSGKSEDYQFVDTGVKLFDTEKDSTVFIRFTSADTQCSSAGLVWTDSDTSADPGYGLCIQGSGVDYWRISTHTFTANNDNKWKNLWANTDAIVITFVSGIPTIIKYAELDGTLHTYTPADGVEFVSCDGTIILGCKYRGDAPHIWNNWAGTINDFRIWNRAFSEDEINALLVVSEE